MRGVSSADELFRDVSHDLLAGNYPAEPWADGAYELLEMRTSARRWGGKNVQLPSDTQYAIYISHHYAGIITNAANWSSPYIMAMIKGDARKFAEQSITEHPAPTAAEIAEADAEVGKLVPKQQFFAEKTPASLPAMVLASSC